MLYSDGEEKRLKNDVMKKGSNELLNDC